MMGTHKGYSAGQEVTDVFKSAHGVSMLNGLAVVGVKSEILIHLLL
ncbi:cytochrome b5-like heme/steroid binding domain-containing protein [Vallitalea pronyensis]|nr:hypothetical protein [Vallitalea pronyensis]